MATVKIIMDRPDVDYLIRDKKGRLPAELAGLANNFELADILIEKENEQANERKIIAHLRYDEPFEDSSGGTNDPNS